MVDYYALPQTGQKAWPGRAAANELPHDDKAHAVQDATLEDLAQHLGMAKQELRFIPYVVMHEFEALLFSDCASFAKGIGRKELGAEFQKKSGISLLRPRKSMIRHRQRPPNASKSWFRGIRSRFLGTWRLWRLSWREEGLNALDLGFGWGGLSQLQGRLDVKRRPEPV